MPHETKTITTIPANILNPIVTPTFVFGGKAGVVEFKKVGKIVEAAVELLWCVVIGGLAELIKD